MPIAILALATEAIKLINLIIEGKDLEQRRIEAKLGFRMLYRVIKPFLGSEMRQEFEEYLAGNYAKLDEEKPGN